SPDDRAFALAPVVSWDAVFSFVLFSSMLFVLELGSLGAALFCATTFACFAARVRAFPATLREYWYLLPFPLFIVLSFLWSNVPIETLKHGAEFAITILAAIFIVSSRNQKSMLLGIFAAFVLYTAVSLAMGHMVDVGDNGARALSGLSDSKNEEADMAATGLVISMFLFAVGVRLRMPAIATAGGAAAALQLYVTVRALSSGAIGGAAAALLVLAGLLAMRKAGRNGRNGMLVAALLTAAMLMALFSLTSVSPLTWAASLFGKDATLTGRTYLWFRARDFVAEHPLLGQGYGAFWQQGNLDAEGLWQFGRITTRQGFNFHNTLYDVLVSLGWIGVTVLAFTFAAGMLRLVTNYIRNASLMTCFWLAMGTYLFVRMPTECVGFNEFYFSTVLLFALLGAQTVRPAPGSEADASVRPAA
ncbi:MAG: O-antigen ligase family protein, partial [Alphaproteobacteria bacterium]|nr:O-antigen ligase family protein [Alphaproteobacteria bacterium]